MKPLAATNLHLRNFSERQQGVERNVRSSSAIEGISAATFRIAASGGFTDDGVDVNTPRVKARVKNK